MRTPLIDSKRRGLTGSALPLLISFVFVGLATAAGSQCAAPYVQVQGQGSAPLEGDPSGQLTIQSISIGEPLISCTTRQLRVVIKVPTLDSANTGMVTPLTNTEWLAEFVIPGTANSSGLPQTIFVSWDTETIPTGTFKYGFVDNSPTGGGLYTSQCGVGGACEATGTVTPDGTITITLDMTTPIIFSRQTATAFTMSALPVGTQLTSIKGTTFVCACAAGNGLLFTQSETLGDGTYTILGNAACSNPPTAALSSNVTSGSAPLTVNFDASASSNTGGCGTLNSYIFTFGDGTQVTQPSPLVSHTYTSGGFFPARVRVTNTAGLTSTNIAQVDVMVMSGPPALSSIVSRKVHGNTGTFDIPLPQSGTSGIECRSGGANGDYDVVFRFTNPPPPAFFANCEGNNAFVSSSGNEHTVHCTGVTNGQNCHVSLNLSVGSFSVVMGVLIGDTTGNGSVNSSDIGQTKSQSGQSVTPSNFRQDVTVNGSINSSDIGLVKSKSGTGIP